MYQLILLKNKDLEIKYFKTQAQAYACVALDLPNKYKIYYPNQNRKLDFVSSYYWDDKKQDFAINVEVAKEIKRNLFREIRFILFEKLDKAFMRALEQDDSNRKNYIINLKNQFRDITEIEFPNTEEELINFMPPIFKEVYDLVV